MRLIGEINWRRLVAAIAVCQAAGIVGTFFTAPAIPAWYASLAKPDFNPPDWVFGSVWVNLYTLMGLALYLVWSFDSTQDKDLKRKALALFGVQLVLNAFWSIIFFGMQQIFAALVEILILLTLIVAVTVKFYQIEKRAGYLMLPYLAWTTFAAYLNFAIWNLNK